MNLFKLTIMLAATLCTTLSVAYHQITQDLINLIDQNGWQGRFQTAVDTARKSGIAEMQDIFNLTDYYNYVDYLVGWMPTENSNGTMVYNNLCKFYFVLDQDSVITLQNPILPPEIYPNQTQTEMSNWLVKFAKNFGAYLNTTASINSTTLQTFYNSPVYNMSQYPVPPGGWKTFNEFFSREINMTLRPIDSPNNDLVIVSGADSEWDGSWDISDNNLVSLKHLQWNISELLEDSAYKDDFEGGMFAHAFLGPTDYHREHAPVAGRVLEAKNIPGNVYLEVLIANSTNADGPTQNLKIARKESRPGQSMPPHKKHPGFVGGPDDGSEPVFWAPDYPGYQFAQARGLIIIDNPVIGKVGVLPVGMAQVSSVILSVKAGQNVTKGQEISKFQFGGSDIVYLFQKNSKVTISADVGTKYLVGTQIAKASALQNHGPN